MHFYLISNRSTGRVHKFSLGVLYGFIGAGLAGSGTIAAQTTAGLRFVPIAPCRIVDTRTPPGQPFISGGTSRDFNIANSSCGVPATANAYSLNVTVVPHGPLGYLTIWPTGQPRPVASTLNSIDGRIKANAAIVAAGTNNSVSVFVSNNSDLVLDINGYFVPEANPAGLAFYTLPPCRIADTRLPNGPFGGPFLSGGVKRTFTILSSSCAAPTSAQAYSLNFTAVPRTALGYLTVWPTGQPRPNVSTLNSLTGVVTANAAIVPGGNGGAIDVFASNNSDLVIDINGYFAPPTTGGLSFYGTTPCRLLDTRQPVDAPQLFGGVARLIGVVSSACGITSAADAYVMNATVVPPGPLGYLTLWPDQGTIPTVSTLNSLDAAITSNMAIVPTAQGSINAFASNNTQFVLDITGYFAPPNTTPAKRPAALLKVSGDPQSAVVNSTYTNPLQARVLDGQGNPLKGIAVTFLAPGTGASVSFGATGNVVQALTDATGLATSPPMQANGIADAFQVTASVGSVIPVTFSLTNTGASGSISISNTSVGKNLQSLITVTLSAPAGSSVPVTLSTSNPAALLLDNTANAQVTVTIPAGQTQAAIAVNALAGSGTVTVTGTAPGYSKGTGTVTLTPSGFVLAGPNGIGVSFSTVVNVPTTLTVYSARLDASGHFAEIQPIRNVPLPVSPINVTLTSTSLGTVTPLVVFNAGDNQQTAQFTGTNTGAATATVQNPAGFTVPTDGSKSVVVTIIASQLVPANATVGQNLETTTGIQINGLVASDMDIIVSSDDPTKLRLSTTATGAGQQSITLKVLATAHTSPQFYVQGFASTGTATYTAMATGFGSAKGTITFAPSGIVFATSDGSQATPILTTPSAGPIGVTVWSATLSAAGTVSAIQPVAGGLSAVVNVTNTGSAAVGTVSPTQVSITAGNVSGSTQFQPGSEGTTTLAVSIPLSPAGFSVPALNFRTLGVTVTKPGSTICDGVLIGNNLQMKCSVIVGQPVSGDTVFTLTSNSASLLISTNPSLAGTSAALVTIPNGGTISSPFYLQALAGAGTGTYTAHATGYSDRTATVTFAPSSIVLFDSNNLPFTTLLHGTSIGIKVMTAQLNAADNTFAILQPLRGGFNLSVTLNTAATNIATVTSPVTINGGVDPSTSPATTTLQGVNTGVTDLTATQPTGFTAATNSPFANPPSFNPTSTIRVTVN